jgi:LDH2 family malate/lactate/ureidoglycolate dehydrogenase
MIGYPEIEGERRISMETLQNFISVIFQRCGMSSEDASLLTDTLVMADLRGCHSHGILRVPEYVRKLTVSGVNPSGQPRVVNDSGAVLVIDGGNSMGQIGATYAMRQAVERAQSTNLAAAAVRGSNHCGAMAYYAMLALPENMIGLATTNALPTMAPWGGSEKILGINPLAVAIPAGEEPPIVLDIAFSASSHGKIRVYQQKGLPIPEGWAFDAQGHPTTETAAALEGLLQPIGGYKGSGLALVMGILSAVLSGASYGTELGNMTEGPKVGQDGHFFMALRVSAFVDITGFKQRVDQIVRQIRTSRLAPEVERIFVPGQLEAETEQGHLRAGIPLNPVTLEGIVQAAVNLGVDPSPVQ